VAGLRHFVGGKPSGERNGGGEDLNDLGVNRATAAAPGLNLTGGRISWDT